MSRLILNIEKLKRFFKSAEALAYQNDLRPMGALFVRNNNEVIVSIDHECSDETFIDCMRTLVNDYDKNNQGNAKVKPLKN